VRLSLARILQVPRLKNLEEGPPDASKGTNCSQCPQLSSFPSLPRSLRYGLQRCRSESLASAHSYGNARACRRSSGPCFRARSVPGKPDSPPSFRMCFRSSQPLDLFSLASRSPRPSSFVLISTSRTVLSAPPTCLEYPFHDFSRSREYTYMHACSHTCATIYIRSCARGHPRDYRGST